MLNKSVISALSFLLLFTWQLTIICANGLLYGQVTTQSDPIKTEITSDQNSDYCFIEIADENSSSTVLVEEVLEEEIHPSELVSVQLVKHLSERAIFYYSLCPTNSNRTFLIPPELYV